MIKPKLYKRNYNRDNIDNLCRCGGKSKFCVKMLHDYQTDAVVDLVDNPKYALWLDMGLGKTIITLTALQLLKDNFMISKILVVAPKIVAQTGWHKEIDRWCHLDLKYQHVIGSQKQKVEALLTPAELYITNRESIEWLIKMYHGINVRSKAKLFMFDTLVLDESSNYKSFNSKRTKSINLLITTIPTLIELTGTPMPKGYEDLYPQMNFLQIGMLAKTITAYRREYFVNVNSMNFIKKDKIPEIHAKIAPFVTSLKAVDVLPPISQNDIYIDLPLPKCLKKQYDNFVKEYLLELGFTDTQVDADEILAVNQGVLQFKLQQFCSGLVYSNDVPAIPKRVHTLKIDKFKEHIEDNKETIAIVYLFKFEFEEITKALPKGSWGDAKKPEDILLFEEGKLQYLLLHPRSASMGLNLQHHCNNMLWYSYTWSLDDYQQMKKRIARQGQTKPCFFYFFLVGDIDKKIIKRLDARAVAQDELMDSQNAFK